MKSMTGYGNASSKFQNLTISIEITSVNRKGLDIQTSLPREWQSLDPKITNITRNHLSRGKLSIYVQTSFSESTPHLHWNNHTVHAVLKQIQQFSNDNNIPFSPNTSLLFDIAKTLDTPETLPDPTTIEPTIEATLLQALKKIIHMREQEGSSLKTDILHRIQLLSQATQSIQDNAKKIVPRQRELLLSRLNEIGLNIDLNDERILKEIALFADKSDISEEITRLQSHLKQFTQVAEENDPVGRKMDFMCQEINRELNTIASKSSLYDITKVVIDAKNELERIREQIQNIE